MHTVGTHWVLAPLPFMEGVTGPSHAGCGAGGGTTALGTNRTLTFGAALWLYPHQEESCAGTQSCCPAGVLILVHPAPWGAGIPFLPTPAVGPAWVCVPPPPPGVGCCSCQSPQDCGPHRARGCWESPFCIPQVGRGSKGSPQPPVSPRLGVLGIQHHLSLAGGGRGHEHEIRAAGVRSPRGAGGDGWELHPRSGHLSSTRLPAPAGRLLQSRPRDHGAFLSNRFPGQAVAHFSAAA